MKYPDDFINQIIQGDCLEVMKDIPDDSIDMVLCDLPYKKTHCNWDVIIPFHLLWNQYKRIVKQNGAILLFGREPFSSMLVISQIKAYRHKWIWNKKQSGSFQNAKYGPLQIDEDVLVFSFGACNYYPIMRQGKMRKRGGAKEVSRVVGSGYIRGFENYSDKYFPINIIEKANPRKGKLHPTEKPVDLCEYLINTYSKKDEIVLDNCIGSGTTAIACLNTNRQFIGIEKEEKYVNISKERINGTLRSIRNQCGIGPDQTVIPTGSET